MSPMMMDLMPRPCRQTIINTKRNTLFREGAYTNYKDMQKGDPEGSKNILHTLPPFRFDRELFENRPSILNEKYPAKTFPSTFFLPWIAGSDPSPPQKKLLMMWMTFL